MSIKLKPLRIIALGALLVVSTLALDAAPLHRGGVSGAATGNVNLDLAVPSDFSTVFPFVDITKSASAWSVTTANTVNGFAPGIQWTALFPAGTSYNRYPGQNFFQPSAIGVFFDDNGDLLSTQPAGAGSIVAQRGLSVSPTVAPNYVGAQMTVTCDNNAGGYTIAIAGFASSTTCPFTFPMPATNNLLLQVSGSGNNPPQHIVIAKTTNIGMTAAGKYIDPDYASWVASASWDLRMMDWNDTNSNLTTYNASTITPLANQSWGAAQINNQNGTPLPVIVSLAKQTNKNIWFNLTQGMMSKISQVASISSANPAVVTCTGPCPFANSETIYFNQGTQGPFAGPLQANPASLTSSVFTATGTAILPNNANITFGMFAGVSGADGLSYPTGIEAGATFVASSPGTTTLTVASVSGKLFPGLVIGGTNGITIVLQSSGTTGGAGVYITSAATTFSSASLYTIGQTYFVVNANQGAGTYQISATPGGSPITLTGSLPSPANAVVNYATVGDYAGIINPTYSAQMWTLNGHGLANGQLVQAGIQVANPIMHSVADTSTYPTGMSKQHDYYIVNSTTNTFQLSATQGGSPLTLTGSMTGTANIMVWLNDTAITKGYTVAGVSGGTLQLANTNTSMFVGNAQSTFGGGITSGFTAGALFKNLNLADILANVGSVASYFRDNMPSNLITVYEPGNEIWNPSFLSFYILQTLGYINSGWHNSGDFAAGYMCAAYAYAVYQTYGGDHTHYQMTFGNNQTGADRIGGSTGAIAGAQQFLADNSLSLTLGKTGGASTYLFDYLPMTSYYGGSYTQNAGPWPATVSFGTNTISFPSGLNGNQGTPIVNANVATIADPIAGLPIMLNTNSPGGTLPSGLSAGTIGSANAGTTGSFTATISGNVLTVNSMNGGFLAAGMTLVSSNPDNVSAGTTINTFGSGGTTGTGTLGTYQLSVSQSTLSTSTTMFTGPAYTRGNRQIYWLVGSAPNYGLATSPQGSPISFTGGSGTNTAVVVSQEAVEWLMNQSISLHNSTPATYPNPWTYFAAQIAQDCIDSRWTGGTAIGYFPTAFSVNWSVSVANYYISNYLSAGKSMAGVKLTAYEGGPFNGPATTFTLYTDPTFVSAFYFEQFSSGQATVFANEHTQLVSSGLLARIAQFQDIGTFPLPPRNDGVGLFGASQFVGDSNARWQGIVNTNSLNFLLKRDIDPASNDNDPMWLEKAA